MRVRERRSWTKEEDNMLRAAIKLEEPHTDRPSKWHSIARHVPGRTNKDCRKRWCATMASIVSKGGWAPEEDRKLLDAVEKHGTKWSLVASLVETRNSGQCAKRWNDTLNPEIDRSAWSPEEDQRLLDAVGTHGTSWTTIVKSNFPGRTALAAKNRYSHLSRSTNSRRGSSPTNSSSDVSEVSTPVSIETSIGSSSFSAEGSTKEDTLDPESVDDIDFMIIDAAADSSSSRSSSAPSTPADILSHASGSTASDSQILENFLTDLASGSDFTSPGCKLGEFPFPENFLTTSDHGSIVQELFNPTLSPFTPDPTYPLPHIAYFDDQPTTINADPISCFWPQLKNCGGSVPSPVHDPTTERISPPKGNPIITDFKIDESGFKPDQQVAVAVAICRAGNLRPTVQILVQSLAGALAQSLSDESLTPPSPSKT